MDASVPYAEVRARLAARDRGLRDKVTTLEDAIGLVRDGDHVGLSGSTLSRTPIALVWALIRARRKDLVVSRGITSNVGEWLYASGVSSHVITSWFCQGIIYGVSRVVRDFTESGRARFEEWSHMSIGLGYRAAAMGLPFLPTRSMLGSDVARQVEGRFRTMTCPYTGETLGLVPALRPDVALIHVQRADRYGNGVIDGLPFMDVDLALAADRVILSCERIVSNDQIRRAPDRTKIPFFCVEAVVEVPFGASPHECYGEYEMLFRHLDRYAKAMRDGGVEACRRWLDEMVYGPTSHTEFLERLGMAELLEAQQSGRRMIWND
ncbi:MAG TPA: CoA-transferase [Thermodesulfobacteriota bacterium]